MSRKVVIAQSCSSKDGKSWLAVSYVILTREIPLKKIGGDFSSYQDALDAATKNGYEITDKKEIGKQLWTVSESGTNSLAVKNKNIRRKSSYKRYVSSFSNPDSRYRVLKVILCTASGDLPQEEQPLNQYVVFREGENEIIDVMNSEELAASLAEFLQKKDDKSVTPDSNQQSLGASGTAETRQKGKRKIKP